MNRTHAVKVLVEEVLPTVRQPYTEDVTLEVCRAIADDPKWLAEYNSLVDRLTVDVVNNGIGKCVRRSLGWKRGRQVRATENGSLVKSYSKLNP